TIAEHAPLIPLSAQLRFNCDALCEFIDKKLPVPQQDYTAFPRFIIIRSFNVNNPGNSIETLKGGVAGGSLIQGVLNVGDEIEIRPGVYKKDENGKFQCYPIVSTITSLNAEKQKIEYAVPGGLIGVGTNIDPSLCQQDRLVGHCLGLKGKLPEICIELTLKYDLFNAVLGVKAVQTANANSGV
ncbi:MAG: translation initiation factor activity, partial [Paramarteilia canceri]